jgi:hypothetical protein
MKKLMTMFAALAMVGSLFAQKRPAKPAAPAPAPAVTAPAAPAAPVVTRAPEPEAAGSSSPKRFSFGFNVGLKGNQANLGDTITKDGTIDTASSTVARTFYATSHAIMSDRNNAAIKYNSGNTGAPFNQLTDYKEGGALTGIDFGAQAQYDMDDLINLPFFLRGAFNYQMTLMGGSQSRTLGDVSVTNPQANALLTANGLTPADYAGGTMTTKFSSSSMEIPISIGFNARVGEKTRVYLGVGASWFNGGWDVKMNIDEKYANALGTHVNTTALTATNYWKNFGGGSLDETVTFRASGIGVHYFLGIEQMLTGDLAVFAEIFASGMAKLSYSSQLSDKAQKLLSSTSSETLAQQDPNWFKRLAFPVVLGGATIKVGMKYYLF